MFIAPPYKEQSVRSAQVLYRARTGFFENAASGEHPVCGDEERQLQKERYRALEDIHRAVAVLSVIGLKDHEALVAFERLPYVLDDGGEPYLFFAGLLLDTVGASVKRQYNKIKYQA